MKVTLTADVHVDFEKAHDTVDKFSQDIIGQRSDCVIVLGDIGDGTVGWNPQYETILTAHPYTYFVLGNHDLWRKPSLNPAKSMDVALARFRNLGIPLERHWEDKDTVMVLDDTAIVGTIGFPDFAHPEITLSTEYWDWNPATCDPDFIDLSRGWVTYTEPLRQAFKVRMEKAASTPGVKRIIVATHYPIFDAQCVPREPDNADVWPFFFNWNIGQDVLRIAGNYPDKTFWCFAGHCHEYCRGSLEQSGMNVYSLGMKATYRKLDLLTLDIGKGFDVLHKELGYYSFTPRWM